MVVRVGTSGNDTLYGFAWNDELYGNEGNDYLYGMAGDDVLFGGDGNDVLDGGLGNDKMCGGFGDDIYIVDSDQDWVSDIFEPFSKGGGFDLVRASISYTLGADIENLELTSPNSITGTGNSLNNTISGSQGNNVLNGNAGNDRLIGYRGNDTLNGGAGNDILVGSSYSFYSIPERDTLTGDSGADIFDLRSANRGTSAVITDFKWWQGDKILVGDQTSSYSFSRTINYGGSSALDTRISYKGQLMAIAWDTSISAADFTFTETPPPYSY